MGQREGGERSGRQHGKTRARSDEEAAGGGAESRVGPQHQRAGSQPLGASSARTFHGALHRVSADRAVVCCGSVHRAAVPRLHPERT